MTVSVLDVKMGHALLGVLVLFWLNTLLYGHAEVPNKAVVTRHPNWTEVYRGERITLRCEIRDGGDTEWEYEWRTTSSEKPSDQNEHIITSVTESHSGDYRCKGRKKHTQHSSTDWSDPIKLTVSDKPRPVLTVSPSWLSAGASVTVNCSVKDPSAGWMFFLYKRVSHPTGLLKSHRFKPLLGSSSGTERDFIIHGQTHTAEFLCNAERGDPGYWYSVHSSSKFAWSSDIHLSPSLTVSPDSAQHFTSGSVSLSCEGNSTEWTVRRSSPEERYQFDCTWWGTLNGSTCNINTDRTSDAVYWCESGSGELSNAVNITIQGGDMILLSPARPVTEGHSVSLSCKSRNQTFDSIVFFYHNEKVIQSDIRWELNISAVSKSDEGFYKCQHSGRESAQSWMSVQANGPKAELRADYRDILVGGSVNLTCSVNPSSSSGWKYFWYRGEKTSEPLTSQLSAGPIRVSEGGVYWCRGGRGEPVNYTEYSDSVTINKIIPNKAVVTLQPNWTEVYVGERITLRCEIKDGGDTEWEYEWRTTSSEKPSDQNEHSITSVTGSHSGDYRCKGRKKHTQHSSTHWSDPIKLTVSDKPQPVITVSPSWLSAGASVTLNCRVKDPSAGWRFYWYKMVPHPSDYRYEQLPGSSSGTEQDSYIVHGQTHTAGYRCRAGRGDPVYSSYSSYSKFVWSADIHSSASLTVSPDRDQKFTSDSVSLSCEGNSAGWRVMRFSTEDKYWSACSTWGTMTGSTCNINTDWPSDAVYWCESGSGEFTNAVNITVQDGDMILLSPARPVTEGDSVSLSCKLRSQTFDSIVFFYHNEKVIQNDSRWELNISAVSKSDEGFYKCQHSGRESAQSWMSVQANRPKAELRADDRDIPVGGSVTLTCSVNPSSSGWKYFWYKGEKTSEPLTSQLSAGPIRVSEGGVYWCRGGRGEPVNYTEYSDSVTIYKIIPNKAFVTLQPNWTEVYRGERITLRCEIKDGGDTEWEYEWRTTSSEKPSDENEHSITSVTGSHSGDYRCKGTKKHTQHSATDWSDPIKLTVSDKPRPVITVSPSWLSAGASVTLNCRVKDPSAGWRFYWYEMVPHPLDYRFEQLPGSSSGTEQDSYIVHGRTHTAGYRCRAGRGDPVNYSEYSNSGYIWSSDIHSSASLTVSPDRAQHFNSDSVSLSCEGNSAEWRVMRSSSEERYPLDCTIWGTMNGSTCNMNTDRTSDAVYWCESGSGEFSNAVNITVQAVSRPDSSSFPVLLIVGLVYGIVLVIHLLVLFCYRASKDTCFRRPMRSESSNMDHVVNMNEAQCSEYSSLPHVAGGSQDVTYSSIQLKSVGKKGKQQTPEERPVYSDVRTSAADSNLLCPSHQPQ